ncbi:MAG TPA: hypothetical protein VMB18_14485 [Terriglobales bacterium]|nr:hypothetical protein [Terriglobales bacterium]
MRHVCLGVLCGLAIMLTGCGGGGNSSGNVSGNWSATLSSKGATILTFNTVLTQGSSSSISVSNLVFTTSTNCFGSGTTASSTYQPSAENGMPANAFSLTMQTSSSFVNGTNQLVLQGTVSNSSIGGTWALTGTGEGCTGSGSFTMSEF